MKKSSTNLYFQSERFKSRIALAFVCILFFLFKIEALQFAYFWDEAWSYIPAIDAMINTMPCLTPGCIDPELYRGHPMFFYFISATWGKIFGDTTVSLHLFALFISVLSLLSLYRTSRLYLSRKHAISCSALLALQVVFFVQSTFLLPEILLTLFTIETYYHYEKRNIFYFSFFGSLLGLTKESGVFILGIFGLFHLIMMFRNKDFNLIKNAWVAFPLIPVGLFFIYQKIKLGWYFFPLHTGMIDISFDVLKKKTDIIINFIFFDQGRYILCLILAGLAIFQSFWKSKNIQAMISFIVAIIGVALYFYKFKILAFLFMIALLISIFHNKPFNKKEQNLIIFSSLFLFSYTVFSAANFLMLRYVLCLFPFVLLLFIVFLCKLNLPKIQDSIVFLLLACSFVFFLQQNHNKGWIDDASTNSFDMIKVHQNVVNTLEKENLYDKKIFVHFLMWHNLTKPALKYLSSSKAFENVEHKGKIPDDAEVIIFSKIELNRGKYDSIRNNLKYRLLKRFESNQAWSEIYVLR